MSEIREILSEKELENSVKVIADSFQTVAVEFNLTKDNCPTHPSFVTVKQLNEMKRKGLKLFGLFENDMQIGFVAAKRKNRRSTISKNWRSCRNTDIKDTAEN